MPIPSSSPSAAMREIKASHPEWSREQKVAVMLKATGRSKHGKRKRLARARKKA